MLNKGTEGKRDGLPALQPDEEQRGKGVGREWREDGRRRQRDEERGKVHAMRKGGEEERKGKEDRSLGAERSGYKEKRHRCTATWLSRARIFQYRRWSATADVATERGNACDDVRLYIHIYICIYIYIYIYIYVDVIYLYVLPLMPLIHVPALRASTYAIYTVLHTRGR